MTINEYELVLVAYVPLTLKNPSCSTTQGTTRLLSAVPPDPIISICCCLLCMWGAELNYRKGSRSCCPRIDGSLTLTTTTIKNLSSRVCAALALYIYVPSHSGIFMFIFTYLDDLVTFTYRYLCLNLYLTGLL